MADEQTTEQDQVTEPASDVADISIAVENDNAEDFDLGIVEVGEMADVSEGSSIDEDNEPTNDADDSEGDDSPSDPESDPEIALDDEPAAKEWDKTRQQKDQELANLRKQNAQLMEVLARPAGEAEAADTGDAEIDLSELDEYADDDARNAVVNQLIRRQKRLEAEIASRDNKAAYHAILAQCDKDFGPEFRNEAINRVKEIWDEAGFGDETYPDAGSTRVAVRGVYAELQNAQLRSEVKGKAAKSTRKPGPKPDTGRGGSVAKHVVSGMLTREEAVKKWKRDHNMG